MTNDDRPPLVCLGCGRGWAQHAQPMGSCPDCGGTSYGITFEETVGALIDEVSYQGRDVAGKKVLKGHARYEVTNHGPMTGTRAWVEQMVDKMSPRRRYRKKVTLADGTVVKDVEGDLSDQSLHGPQNDSEG